MLLAQQKDFVMQLQKQITVLLILTFAAVGNPVFAQDWVEYKPSGIGYRVELPAAPQIMTREAPTQIGQIRTTIAFVERGPIAFIVSHNDYPPSIKSTTTEQVLDGVRNGQIGTNKLRSEEKIQISGHPARHLVIETGQGKVIISRIVMVETRLFQAMYVGPKSTEESEEAKRFIASFMLAN